MSKTTHKDGFILAESLLCLFSLTAVSLSLAQTVISGEKSVKISQEKLDQVFSENQRLKKELAQNE